MEAIIIGIAAFGAAGGVAAGGTAIAIGAAAAAGSMLLEQALAPDAPDAKAPVQIGDKGTPIDKSAMQKEADVGKLKLGEDDKKNKRKKGKAAFKIELDKKAKEGGEQAVSQGVQVKAPKETGVQL